MSLTTLFVGIAISTLQGIEKGITTKSISEGVDALAGGLCNYVGVGGAQEIVSEATKAIASLDITEHLENAVESVTSVIQDNSDTIEEVLDTAGDVLEGVLEVLGDIL